MHTPRRDAEAVGHPYIPNTPCMPYMPTLGWCQGGQCGHIWQSHGVSGYASNYTTISIVITIPGPSCRGVLAGLLHTTALGFQTGHPDRRVLVHLSNYRRPAHRPTASLLEHSGAFPIARGSATAKRHAVEPYVLPRLKSFGRGPLNDIEVDPQNHH